MIVDGYNILNAWPELRKLIRKTGLSGARAELIRYLSAYQDCTGVEVTLVFDGPKKEASISAEAPGDESIKVIYSKSGKTADTYIERLVYQSPEPGSIRVATSDRQLKLIVLGMGARQISATGLEKEVLRAIEEFKQEHIKSGHGQTRIKRTRLPGAGVFPNYF